MIKLKAFELSFGTAVIRFYLMMAVVIVAGFIGQWWLAILALPIFLSIMMGVKIETGDIPDKKEGKIVRIKKHEKKSKAS